MALKLSLKPEEKLVINGAVIANGDRRTTLVVHNKASILREKDIMQEDQVNTPVSRVYFPLMLMYMEPAKDVQYYDEFAARIAELMTAFSTPEAIELCVKVSKDVLEKNYYRALMNCKKLLVFESEILGRGAS